MPKMFDGYSGNSMFSLATTGDEILKNTIFRSFLTGFRKRTLTDTQIRNERKQLFQSGQSRMIESSYGSSGVICGAQILTGYAWCSSGLGTMGSKSYSIFHPSML